MSLLECLHTCICYRRPWNTEQIMQTEYSNRTLKTEYLVILADALDLPGLLYKHLKKHTQLCAKLQWKLVSKYAYFLKTSKRYLQCTSIATLVGLVACKTKKKKIRSKAKNLANFTQKKSLSRAQASLCTAITIYIYHL